MANELSFYISKDQIGRIKNLQNFIKKLEAISPLNQAQLFVVENNKLSIYGYGNGSLGSGHIQCSFDLVADTSRTNDNFYFSCSILNFIKFLEKTKSDVTKVTLEDKSTLVFKGESTKSVFKQTILATVDAEVEEIRTAVSNYPNSNYYKASKTIKLANSKNEIGIASSILALLNTNKFIKISNKNIRVADDCSIVDLKTDIEEDAYLHKATANLFADVDEIKYYEDEAGLAWIYADASEYGIQLYFVQEESDYQCPTDEELAELAPKDKYVTIKIKSEDLFNAFNEFKDVFSNESWQYKQISMTTNITESKFQLHFDDMVTFIDAELPFEVIENTETEQLFNMMLPFIELNQLEPLIKENETLTLKYSSNPDDVVVNISPDDGKGFNNIIITKLMH